MKEKIMEAVNRYLDAFRKYVNFNGRASRRDYWSFVIVNMVVSCIIGLLEAIVGLDDGFISSLYTLAVVCPNICLCTRRLHDVNKSGWWQLAVMVPFLNFYVFYLVWIKKGNPETNKYGAPVAASAADAYSVPVANEFADYNMCPVPKPVQAKKCAYCGTELEEGSKFCSECGAPVGK